LNLRNVWQDYSKVQTLWYCYTTDFNFSQVAETLVLLRVLRLRLCVLRLVNDTLTCWASSVKRLLDVWQKRSTCMAKETYMHGKRDLHV